MTKQKIKSVTLENGETVDADQIDHGGSIKISRLRGLYDSFVESSINDGPKAEGQAETMKGCFVAGALSVLQFAIQHDELPPCFYRMVMEDFNADIEEIIAEVDKETEILRGAPLQ